MHKTFVRFEFVPIFVQKLLTDAHYISIGRFSVYISVEFLLGQPYLSLRKHVLGSIARNSRHAGMQSMNAFGGGETRSYL